MNVSTIPSSSQDTVWDPSTSLMGQMASCFILYETITDVQARLLYELGPNNYYINWLDIIELNDIKQKLLLYYDAKCVKDLCAEQKYLINDTSLSDIVRGRIQ